jgi:hypothetical protein
LLPTPPSNLIQPRRHRQMPLLPTPHLSQLSLRSQERPLLSPPLRPTPPRSSSLATQTVFSPTFDVGSQTLPSSPLPSDNQPPHTTFHVNIHFNYYPHIVIDPVPIVTVTLPQRSATAYEDIPEIEL